MVMRIDFDFESCITRDNKGVAKSSASCSLARISSSSCTITGSYWECGFGFPSNASRSWEDDDGDDDSVGCWKANRHHRCGWETYEFSVLVNLAWTKKGSGTKI